MKTKISKYILFTLIISAFAFSACEDYLEMKTVGKVPQDDFYSNEAFVSTSILAAYDMLQTLYAEDWNSLWLVKTLMSDEINCGGGNSSDQPPYQDLSRLSHTPSNAVLNPVYQKLYAGIYRCNLVLTNVGEDNEVKLRTRAEAKCLRAYFNFELVTLWGNVPLVNEILENGTNPGPATPAQIWAQIEQDLNDAVVDLKDKANLQGADAFRVSKGTAYSLLGKALLYQGKYSDAAAAFQKVIDSKQFSLGSNFSQILRASTEFGPEAIFEVPYITTEGHTWGNGTFPWGNGRRQENNIHWQLCGPRGDGYFSPGSTGLIPGWGFAYPRKAMYDAFTDANDIIRRNSSMMSEATIVAAGGTLRKDDTLAYDCEGFVRLKYGTWADETNVSTQAELNYGTDVRVIRYADVLLMAAEAYNKSGDDGNAEFYLNQVRKRVSLDTIANTTGTALFDEIVSERQRELMFEGVRFLDLVRWGLAPTVLAYKQTPYSSKHALLPIPADELAVNPNMKPNPGW